MLNETFRVYIIFEYCGNNAPFDVYDYDMDHLGIIRGPYIFHKMHEIENLLINSSSAKFRFLFLNLQRLIVS